MSNACGRRRISAGSPTNRPLRACWEMPCMASSMTTRASCACMTSRCLRGFTDVAAFNAALESALHSRHLFKNHPLDQSLRHGSQTARNLMTDQDQTVQALLGAFAAPLADYVRSLEVGENHPLNPRGPRRCGFAGLLVGRTAGLRLSRQPRASPGLDQLGVLRQDAAEHRGRLTQARLDQVRRNTVAAALGHPRAFHRAASRAVGAVPVLHVARHDSRCSTTRNACRWRSMRSRRGFSRLVL